MNSTLTPVQRYVADCLRYVLGPDDIEIPPPHPSPSLDWEGVVKLAYREGLAATVYVAALASDHPAPEPWTTSLRTAYLGAVARTGALLEPTISSAVGALQSAGIHPVLLKGAALAATVYPESYYRSMADVDLLVPPAQSVRAGAVLADLGFDEGAATPTDHHHTNVRNHPTWQLGIEVHHDLIPSPNPYAVDVAGCLARCEVADVAGLGALVLAPPDALQLACLHLAWSHRYRWYPLRGLADILAITSAYQDDLDWDVLLATARRWRTAGALYWPLRMAAVWLGAPVPPAILESLVPASRSRELVGTFADPVFLLENRSPDGPGGDVLYGILLEYSLRHGCSAGARARALYHGFFPPPEAVGHLPPEVTGSRPRYLAELCRPDRLARGAGAVTRLLSRTPHDGGPRDGGRQAPALRR